MKIKSGFEITQEDGVYVARAVGERAKEFPNGVQMGLSGAYLWEYMTKNDCTRAELVFQLDGFFESETSTEQVAQDVDIFVNFLQENGLLEA